MAGASQVDFRLQTNESVENAGVLTTCNQAMMGIIHSRSSKSAQTYAQALDGFLEAWSSVQTGMSKMIVEAVNVGLATLQYKELKKQLTHQRDIAKAKSSLVQQQIDISRDNINRANTHYNDIYKGITSRYTNLISQGININIPAYNDYYAGLGQNESISQLDGQVQKVKNTTNAFCTGALTYKTAKIEKELIVQSGIGAGRGYLVSLQHFMEQYIDKVGREEKLALQANNVATQSNANINLMAFPISQLNADVGRAQDNLLGGLGNLAGSVYNLFSDINRNVNSHDYNPADPFGTNQDNMKSGVIVK